ncbi:SRPBCC family protein [Defluviimonas sp. D31]|uniref:SRPBCC family protein n=1 Tax=Defluviimonas sp. D31 TaxID=3083253 RepID=UPI00296FA7BF|nr:SRPBCC family protein [Defluviimonas sp. D31]MDW4550403.1 SRPBCC family protein [Defluviimonas sp. D31]
MTAPASFSTLAFERKVAAPPATLWQAWTDPSMRALWAAPSAEVTVDFLQADTRVGGREISLCRAKGQPDIRCEVGWLLLAPPRHSVNYEVLQSGGHTLSTALVTAEIAPEADGSRLRVTVQLSSAAEDMETGYRQGFGAGLDNLIRLSGRMMVFERDIAAPLDTVWAAWTDPAALPQWWGPNGYSCRTARIDLREGGEWVFDMIGPDGTVYPNHHRYTRHVPRARIDYTLHWGENGPKHADASVRFEDHGGRTRVTLTMIFATAAEYDAAKGFGAVELGQETLGKLAAYVGASRAPVAAPEGKA